MGSTKTTTQVTAGAWSLGLIPEPADFLEAMATGVSTPPSQSATDHAVPPVVRWAGITVMHLMTGPTMGNIHFTYDEQLKVTVTLWCSRSGSMMVVIQLSVTGYVTVGILLCSTNG